MKPIPIKSAQEIAEQFGYDQVVIIARAVGQGEHVTTYGVDDDDKVVAARIGDFLISEIMKWERQRVYERGRVGISPIERVLVDYFEVHGVHAELKDGEWFLPALDEGEEISLTALALGIWRALPLPEASGS